MALISFLGIFYIILLVGLIILYNYEKEDKWFKAFYFIGTICIFILLTHYTYFQTNIDNNNNLIIYRQGLEEFDYETPTLLSSNISITDDNIKLYRFNTIDTKKESIINDASLCLYYNNKNDGNNEIILSNGFIDASDSIYIKNNSSDIICVHLNADFVRKDYMLGFKCVDCDITNTLDIRTISTEQKELISKSETSYSITNTNTPAIYINSVIKPIEQVNNNFWLFMKTLSVFIMMFIFRILYKTVEDNV